MSEAQISEQLKLLTTAANPVHYCYDLVAKWKADSVAPGDVMDDVLCFMEEHPDVDLGLPGPLIPFLETNIPNASYADSIMRSVQRKPVPYNVWMLERLLKVTSDAAVRKRLISVLETARESL